MTRTRRAATVAMASMLAIGGVENIGCEDAYTAPCRVVASAVVVHDPTLGLQTTLVQDRDRVVATWARVDVADGGADSGTRTLPSIQSFDVAVIDGSGRLGLRTTVAAPDALRARVGSILEADLLVEDGAFLVHWIDTALSTEPTGLHRIDATTKLAYVGDGVAAAAIAPVSCERCTMTHAAVSLGSESLVLVRTEPDPDFLPDRAAVIPSFTMLRVRRDGAVVQEHVPWLGAPTNGDGGVAGVRAVATPPVLRVDALGRVVVVTDGLAWLVDPALRVLAGPVTLPNAADRPIAWDARGEASIFYAVSPFSEGRATDSNVALDVFLGRVFVGGFGIATRQRAGSGRAALAVDRNDGPVGVLYDSVGRIVFAELDADGRRHGGDLELGARTVLPSSGGSAYTPGPVLVARGGGRFAAVSLGAGELDVKEIACER